MGQPAAVAPSKAATKRVAAIQSRLARQHSGACVDLHRAVRAERVAVLLQVVPSGRPRHCAGDARIQCESTSALLGRRVETERGGSVPRLAGSKRRDGAEPAQQADRGRERARDNGGASPSLP
jgi:hypothetical protein